MDVSRAVLLALLVCLCACAQTLPPDHWTHAYDRIREANAFTWVHEGDRWREQVRKGW
jgi:hypothetical protein